MAFLNNATTVIDNSSNATLGNINGTSFANEVHWGTNGMGVLDTASNMNTLNQKSGFYLRDNPTNGPFGTWTTWLQLTGHYPTDNYGWQLAKNYWGNDWRFRGVTNNSWGSWLVNVLYDNNVAAGALYTTIVYDSNNTAYYSDPSGTSNLNASIYNGQISARAGQSSGSLITATGGLGGIEVYGGGGSNAAFINFHRPGAFAAYFGIESDGQFAIGGWSYGAALGSMKVGSFGVGTAASGTAGEIRATNNISAYYSDIRLKTITGKITNALEKIMSLNGYYYVENDLAKSYGYNNKLEQVGVSAQEIEAVLPHVVTAAPFDIAKDESGIEYSKSGENYKTVRYDRLAPLLIEAIKELKKEIQELREKN